MPGNYPSRDGASNNTRSASSPARQGAGSSSSVGRSEAFLPPEALPLASRMLPLSARGAALLIPGLDLVAAGLLLYELYQWYQSEFSPPSGSTVVGPCWGPAQYGPNQNAGADSCGVMGGALHTEGTDPNSFLTPGLADGGTYWRYAFHTKLGPPAFGDPTLYELKQTMDVIVPKALGEPVWTAPYDPESARPGHPGQYLTLFPWALPIGQPAPPVRPLPQGVAREMKSDPFPQGFKMFEYTPEAPAFDVSDIPIPEAAPEYPAHLFFEGENYNPPYWVPGDPPPEEIPNRYAFWWFDTPQRPPQHATDHPGRRPAFDQSGDPQYWDGTDYPYLGPSSNPLPQALADALLVVPHTIDLKPEYRRIGPLEHEYQKPPRHVREVKVFVGRNAAGLAVLRAFNKLSEVRDISNALYWALPQVKTASGKSHPKYPAFNDYQRFKAVWDHVDEVDAVKAINNIVDANLKDMVAASKGKDAAKAQQALDKRLRQVGGGPSLGTRSNHVTELGFGELRKLLGG